MKRLVWLALALLAPFVSVQAHSRAPLPLAQDNAPGWCVSVWYPSSDSGGLDSIRANASQINVIHPFWYSPDPNGGILIMQGGEDPALLAEWRADELTIIPTIMSGIPQVITDPNLRDFHIGQIVGLAERMNYDGIDIDYESFPADTRDDFSTFIEALSERLHAEGKLLTIAVHAKTDDAGTWYGAAAQDWTRLAPAADVFTVMTYDYTNRNQPPGPIAPTDWVRAVLTYAASVTDLSKVRMGLPFYGYTWQRDNPPATTTNWQAAHRLIESFGVEIERDPADMEAHIEVKVRGLPKQTIFFADSIGIQYKMDAILAEFPDLGGVAVWGIGGEDPADWDVLRAVRQPNCRLTT